MKTTAVPATVATVRTAGRSLASPLFLGSLALFIGCTLGLSPRPSVSVKVIEPLENGKFIFQRLAPASKGSPSQARISLRIEITNNRSSPVELERIEINGEEVSSFDTPVLIPGGGTDTFQNCRCSDDNRPIANSRPLVVTAPFPTTATVAVYVAGEQHPFTETVSIERHTNNAGPLLFPGQASDLKSSEAWQASSNHVADHQVFALDMGVRGWNGANFGSRYPDTDDTSKENWRVYGSPVYAMAGGTVCFAVNDHEEWPHPTDRSASPTSPSLGGYSRGGNHIFVKTGDEISLYAHLQPGSIPPELVVVGAPVQRGQYLGKVGLSGDTSGPHLHIHVKKERSGGAPKTGLTANGCDAGFFRPMTFANNSLTVDEANELGELGQLDSTDWTLLTDHSASHPDGLLHPTSFTYDPCLGCDDDFSYVGIWRTGSQIELRVKAQGWTAFAAKYDALQRDSFRLADIETFVENGQRQFIGLFQRGSGGYWIIRVTGWDNFTREWEDQSNSNRRLVDITTYRDTGSNLRWYIGVFRPGSDGYALVGLPGWDAFTQSWADVSADGQRLVDLEVYKENAVEHFIGVYRRGTDGHALINRRGWDAFVDSWREASENGLRLVDLESIPVHGARQYIGAFRAGSHGHGLYRYTGYAAFFRASERLGYEGQRLVDVHVER